MGSSSVSQAPQPAAASRLAALNQTSQPNNIDMAPRTRSLSLLTGLKSSNHKLRPHSSHDIWSRRAVHGWLGGEKHLKEATSSPLEIAKATPNGQKEPTSPMDGSRPTRDARDRVGRWRLVQI